MAGLWRQEGFDGAFKQSEFVAFDIDFQKVGAGRPVS
jgi:hypothetical protein